MTETGGKEHKSSQPAESPAIESNNTKPKHPGGRPRKETITQPVQELINLAAPVAAQILKDHIDRKRSYKTLRASLQRACEYVIDHAIGKARQKVEHSGGILTYADLARGASNLDDKPRPILADVMEIANKYDREHPETTPPAGPKPSETSDS